MRTQVEVEGEKKPDFDLELKTLTFDPVASIRHRVVGNLLSTWTRWVAASHRDAAGECPGLPLSPPPSLTLSRSADVVKSCCAAD